MTRRGQATLEYMFTYGWAFLGIIITIGALTYFGVFDTSNLRGSECSFPPGVSCHDYTLWSNPGYPELVFELRNTYGATINVTEISMDSEKLGDDITCGRDGAPIPPAYVWEQENITRYVCDLSTYSGNYFPGDNYEMIVTINFTQANHTYQHYTKGVVFATAQ